MPSQVRAGPAPPRWGQPGEVPHRHGLGPRAQLQHRHPGGLQGRAHPAGPGLCGSLERLRQALHAAAGHRGPRLRHEDRGTPTGQCSGHRRLLHMAAGKRGTQHPRKVLGRGTGRCLKLAFGYTCPIIAVFRRLYGQLATPWRPRLRTARLTAATPPQQQDSGQKETTTHRPSGIARRPHTGRSRCRYG